MNKRPRFANVDGIGNLYFVHLLWSFDNEDILFVCESDKDDLYLCMCSDALYQREYLIRKVSTNDILELVKNKISVYGIFEREQDRLWVATYNQSKHDFDYIRKRFADFPEDELFKKDEFLDLEFDEQERETEFWLTRETFKRTPMNIKEAKYMDIIREITDMFSEDKEHDVEIAIDDTGVSIRIICGTVEQEEGYIPIRYDVLDEFAYIPHEEYTSNFYPCDFGIFLSEIKLIHNIMTYLECHATSINDLCEKLSRKGRKNSALNIEVVNDSHVTVTQ